MILAAGLGKRMRPLTDTLPKPLLPVADKPLIDYHIERLVAAGVRELVINLAYLGHLVEAHLGDGSRWGITIHYSREPEPLETAGGICRALPLLGEEPFLLVNGDVWSDCPFAPLLGMTLAEGQLGHLLLVPNPGHNSGGDFDLREGRLIRNHKPGGGYTFSGISLLHPALLTGYPRRRDNFPLREVFDYAIEQQALGGEVFRGQWWDIGTPERLQALDQQLRTG
ncbi:N-acetylmuramate alpha-1-phosphate uridylyltransferase MurU [Pseudomaricurvus sp. HS19]|uniref:N-acetylmuramate alpha-1-phosphate uridylyltransferase MurU n=1 Tax=Pseudomaricurvus sp. HS19 TaxID=2692626 RepID=UPI00136DD2F4|nr:nucleotidyltransferase family protein [Pseudomaricurvus sp. HS19]MYM64341.1 NTP transferase domain-containing protein [Pseudomaricurvus sp. HS19]